MAKNITPIGNRINSIRERRGISLYSVAKRAHMDYAQLYRTLRSERPTRESLLKICKALACTSQEAAEVFYEAKYTAPTPEEMEEPNCVAA